MSHLNRTKKGAGKTENELLKRGEKKTVSGELFIFELIEWHVVCVPFSLKERSSYVCMVCIM